MLSRSRSVAEAGDLFKVSKSIVIPYGIAIWSVRAYRRPMDPLLSSTRCETAYLVSSEAIIKKNKLKHQTEN